MISSLISEKISSTKVALLSVYFSCEPEFVTLLLLLVEHVLGVTNTQATTEELFFIPLVFLLLLALKSNTITQHYFGIRLHLLSASPYFPLPSVSYIENRGRIRETSG
jgi:hypothetical protein